jgi:hypothetical protein
MAERAVLAVLLTIGFYLLAIGLIAGLLAIPYLEVTPAHRLNIRLTLFCLIGAAVILFSILPSFERFTPSRTLRRGEPHRAGRW